jgi:serralysin
MALAPVWNYQQIVDQLNSNALWFGSVITYAFPSTTAGMTSNSGEAAGFQAFSLTQQTSARLAISLWDDLIAPSVQPTLASNSYIEFGNSTRSAGVDYAQTYFPNEGTAWFNTSYGELASPVVGFHGFETYIHELGHAFGLNHMGIYNGNGNFTPNSYQDSTVYSIMSYFGPSWGNDPQYGIGQVAWANWTAGGVTYSPQTPMLYDVLAIQLMYGADPTTRTGDTTYGFNSSLSAVSGGIYDFTQNHNPIMCIYDATGNDTLDVSGWSTNATIDLHSGAFSSVNGMTNNITIAYSAIIENAVGGGGNDYITANDYGDRINGGGGNDSLVGGAGNDTLIGGNGSDTIYGVGGNDTIYTSTYAAGTGGSSYVDGGEGTDTIVAYGSADALFGGNGDDILVAGSGYTNYFYGGAGTDTFVGSGGTDYLNGGDGGDYVQGGKGTDYFVGGNGTDYFIMNTDVAATQYDLVFDFAANTDYVGLPTYLMGNVFVQDTAYGVDIYCQTGGGWYQILFTNTHNAAQVQADIYYYGV